MSPCKEHINYQTFSGHRSFNPGELHLDIAKMTSKKMTGTIVKMTSKKMTARSHGWSSRVSLQFYVNTEFTIFLTGQVLDIVGLKNAK